MARPIFLEVFEMKDIEITNVDEINEEALAALTENGGDDDE